MNCCSNIPLEQGTGKCQYHDTFKVVAISKSDYERIIIREPNDIEKQILTERQKPIIRIKKPEDNICKMLESLRKYKRQL